MRTTGRRRAGDAVLEVFAESEQCPRIVKLAVRKMPGSGLSQGVSAAEAALGLDGSRGVPDYRHPLDTFTQTISTVIALHFYKLAV